MSISSSDDEPRRPEELEPDPRVTFANERTFLAWNRTALALIAAAVAVTQLFSDVPYAARVAIATPLLALGALIALTSHGRWRANQLALRRGAALPGSSLPLLLAAGVALAAGITVFVVVGGLL